MNSFISTDEKLCIGCKICEIACAVTCPYGVMTVATRKTERVLSHAPPRPYT